MKFFTAVVLAIAPCSATAAPTFLKCQLDADVGSKPAWDVTLNEEAGAVVIVYSDLGRSYTFRGIFTADKVMFNGFTIDRTNFAFKRDMSGLQAPGRTPLIDRGKCALAKAVRAF